jgi:dinuclear metal center YbgI/SA1388 family protein
VGLQVGAYDWPVKKIWVALEATGSIVSEGCAEGVDLLITHHPLIFRPLRRIDLGEYTGRIIQDAVEHRLAVFCAHTNLDSASGGVNDVLAEKLSIHDIIPLRQLLQGEEEAAHARGPASRDRTVAGLGRIGNLLPSMTLAEFSEHTRDRLGLATVKIAGDAALSVSRVAVCGGSGRGLMDDFFASDAHVYVSGDLGYHDGRRAEAEGRALIDVGHFASEQLIVKRLALQMNHALSEKGYRIEVSAYEKECDCFYYL